MEEMLNKLEILANSPKAKEIFNGSPEAVQAKLRAEGIELSQAEFEAFVAGVCEEQDDELCEKQLDYVAGGKTYAGYDQDCYNAGKKIGKVIKKVWNFFSQFATKD